jgi:hypothetical protein
MATSRFLQRILPVNLFLIFMTAAMVFFSTPLLSNDAPLAFSNTRLMAAFAGSVLLVALVVVVLVRRRKTGLS